MGQLDKQPKWKTECSDCTALQDGRRSVPGEHEYLVLRNPSRRIYECLICGTRLAENNGRWASVSAFEHDFSDRAGLSRRYPDSMSLMGGTDPAAS